MSRRVSRKSSSSSASASSSSSKKSKKRKGQEEADSLDQANKHVKTVAAAAEAAITTRAWMLDNVIHIQDIVAIIMGYAVSPITIYEGFHIGGATDPPNTELDEEEGALDVRLSISPFRMQKIDPSHDANHGWRVSMRSCFDTSGLTVHGIFPKTTLLEFLQAIKRNVLTDRSLIGELVRNSSPLTDAETIDAASHSNSIMAHVFGMAAVVRASLELEVAGLDRPNRTVISTEQEWQTEFISSPTTIKRLDIRMRGLYYAPVVDANKWFKSGHLPVWPMESCGVYAKGELAAIVASPFVF